MNFKQKLAYMTLGCIFTLAGYILANLGGNGFAQEGEANQKDGDKPKLSDFIPELETPPVIDEIVCRKLKLVDSEGKVLALLGPSPVVDEKNLGIALFTVYNAAGNPVFHIGTNDTNSGYLSISNAEGKSVVTARNSPTNGGALYIYNAEGYRAVTAADIYNSGFLCTFNAKGNRVVTLSEGVNGGALYIYNAEGKSVVTAMDGINGGALYIYNAEGKSVITATNYKNDGGHLSIGGGAEQILFSKDSMAIFNKGGENVLQASISKQGGGIIVTRDKLGYHTGQLPR